MFLQRSLEERARRWQPARFSRVVVYMRRLFLVLTLAGVSALAQTRERVRPAEGIEVPDGVDDARATMVEPLACVLRGAEHVPRGRVLVVGNGFVGRLFAAVLARRGDDVFAIDTDPGRAGRTPDGPVDAAVVCARGAGAAALDVVEPGGTVLLFADAGSLPADTVYRRELTVVGSRSATPRCPLATTPRA